MSGNGPWGDGRGSQSFGPGGLPPVQAAEWTSSFGQPTPKPGAAFLSGLTRAFRRSLDFQGRASRTEFWSLMAFSTVAVTAADLIEGEAGTALLSTLVIVALALPILSAATRRLHDQGRSGTWVAMGLVPFLGVIAVCVLCIPAGDVLDNEYGAPPQA